MIFIDFEFSFKIIFPFKSLIINFKSLSMFGDLFLLFGKRNKKARLLRIRT
jgi:hypothetical protein